MSSPALRVKKREYIDSKKNVPCADCGNSYPTKVMDFHHRNESEKDLFFESSRMKLWSIKRIDEELDKCVVLCANCHRIRHI